MKAQTCAIALLATIWAGLGCSGADTAARPFELQRRLPPLQDLFPRIPGSRGADGLGRAAVFDHLEQARGHLGPLNVLDAYFTEGGSIDRNVAPVIALEGMPHVADQVVRYARSVDPSRLDVEPVTDHMFTYLQYGGNGGYDPDTAISEKHMLIDGSTVVPSAIGTRASIAEASGIASPNRGYMRVHFNRRSADANPAHRAVQVDYAINEAQSDIHLSYFLSEDNPGEPEFLALWFVRQANGGGIAMLSVKEQGTVSYGWLAQYRADGSLAVWKDDGSLWGCSSGDGAELGDAELPDPCAEFNEPFPKPPSISGVWPGLPSSIPR